MENYRKIRELGEGGFGTAFLVERIADGVKFVIKEVSVVGLTESELNYVEEEAIKMINLRQLNVVKYEAHWFDGKKPPEKMAIVMEYCDCGDLGQKIREAEGCYFHERKIIGWFEQMCAAIKQCHDRQIIHRDLKAENFFLTMDGTRIKLGDFGVARVLENTTSGGIKNARTLAGTVTHIAPEMYEGEYDTKVDIWSLGVCLYHLCNLELPFIPESGDDNLTVQSQMSAKVQNLDFKPLQGHYSKRMKDIVNKCLQIDPAMRPTIDELQEMVDALKFQLEKSRTITPRPPTKPPGNSATKQTIIKPANKVSYKPPGSKSGNQQKHYTVENNTPGGIATVSTINENGKKRTELPMGISAIHNGVWGTMSVIVDAKSPLKDGINQNKVYYTHEDNQTECTIQIYEGFGKMVSENNKIGEFELSGFPAKPRGEVKILVTFKINKLGVLTVEACDAENFTANKASIGLKKLEYLTVYKK